MNRFCFVDLWPSLADFAADIGVTYGTAKGIRHRERRGLGIVPDCYWRRAVAGAEARGIAGVTLEALSQAAESLALAKDAPVADQRSA